MRPLEYSILFSYLLPLTVAFKVNNDSFSNETSFEDDPPFNMSLFFDCRCESRCLLTLPTQTRPPDYSVLNQCLEEKGFRSSGKELRSAVQKLPDDQPLQRMPVIRFGFLVEVKYPYILGVISLAVEHINNSTEILPNVQLEFTFERIYSKFICIFPGNSNA